MLDYPDQVRWFEKTGECRGSLSGGGCAKPAIGVLRGPQNESYGAYCQQHADKRLREAKAAREKYAAATKGAA